MRFLFFWLIISSGFGMNLYGRPFSRSKFTPSYDTLIDGFKVETSPGSAVVPGQKVYSLEEKIDFINDQFLLYAPLNYNDPSISSFPTIIFLHGRDEAGTDINLVKRHGLPKLLDNRKDFNFIVISPQLPPRISWEHTDKLHEFLWELIQRFKIDPKQVYLTGLSSGGTGTYYWAKDYPDDFAAIAPVSGVSYWDIADQLRFTPTWIFHGLKDYTIPIHGDSVIFQKLVRLGDEVHFTVYPLGGHNIWDQTYLNKNLYSWFLKFRSQKN